jgi:hypothetical protein
MALKSPLSNLHGKRKHGPIIDARHEHRDADRNGNWVEDNSPGL